MLAYFILTVLIIPGDYWIIEPAHFGMIAALPEELVNGALRLPTLLAFSYHKKLEAAFSVRLQACGVLGGHFHVTADHDGAYATLKHQAMMIICMIYILGYILTGVKPAYMLAAVYFIGGGHHADAVCPVCKI